jgi:D-alanine--D-alanine ligase
MKNQNNTFFTLEKILLQELRLGILMGGKSLEAEVSFNSGRTICDQLNRSNTRVVPLFQTKTGTLYILPWHFLHRGKINDFESRLATEATKIDWQDLHDLVDFIYIAQHGQSAEDGVLQGTLEVLGIPYFGSKVFASALGMDKKATKKWLSTHGIATPPGIAVSPHEPLTLNTLRAELDAAHLLFPLIVKPAHEGSSYGVSCVTTENELLAAIECAREINPKKAQEVLIEQQIQGIEFSCITIQKQNEWIALAVTQLMKNDQQSIYDYEQKYMPGRAFKKTPADLAPDQLKAIEETCIKTSKTLGFQTIGRIDGIYTAQGEIVIIDPNSLSGMAPNAFIFDQAALHNLSHNEIINHLIDTELAFYQIEVAPPHQEKEIFMHHHPKKKIAVLLGGNTNEREVSFDSGRNVFYKLSTSKYQATPIFVDDLLELYEIPATLLIKNSTAEIKEKLTPEMKIRWSTLAEKYDFAFLGLHGGAGENGSIQGFLEMLEIPYNGSGVFASALCMDKYKANEWFKAHDIAIPEHRLIDISNWETKSATEQKESLERQLNQLAFPLISKPHNDGCSVLVDRVETIDHLLKIIEKHRAKKNDLLLCEELILGMELTVGVLGNHNPIVLPASQAVSVNAVLSMEEKFLPGAGENQTPAPLSAAAAQLVQETILKTYQAAQCQGYARIDCFYQSADQSPTKTPRVVILEINTLPALTPATCLFHQAAEVGIRPIELIDKIIELGFEAHAQKNILINTQKELQNSEKQ